MPHADLFISQIFSLPWSVFLLLAIQLRMKLTSIDWQWRAIPPGHTGNGSCSLTALVKCVIGLESWGGTAVATERESNGTDAALNALVEWILTFFNSWPAQESPLEISCGAGKRDEKHSKKSGRRSEIRMPYRVWT
ncbi:hypothetical protein PGTUg99_007440 [Puccinia graminis f. sp. tritici]|uniref:Uncharacterized protein n=1 Tax=Puccinia graminis f. sp. tritici TaxID=56615 RepID=A0A5B0QYP4_PUCGR|nr:hypothetical protein PGTUg99_007440 [Puccinia graminis f. sp. tritici]